MAATGPLTATRTTTHDATLWRRVLANCAVVTSATLVAQALGAATSLALRFLLNPAQMGVWQGLKLALTYANFTNLGASKAAVRELSLARGRGRAEEAQRDLALAHTVNLAGSLLYAGVLVAAAAWLLARGGASAVTWGIGLAAVSALAILQRFVTYRLSILRAQEAFGVTARVTLAEAAVGLIGCTLGAWLWGLPGLYAATLAVLLASLALTRGRLGLRLHWAWDFARIRAMIAIGLPILLAGIGATLFRSLDKVMILAYLPDREYQLGCYSLALLAATQLFGLANMLATVLLPRYGFAFGQSQNPREVAGLALRAMHLQAAAASLFGALAVAAGPAVLGRLLPAYRPGLDALLLLVPGIVAMSLTLPAAGYLVAVNRPRRNLAALGVSILLAAVGNHLALVGGAGLCGVALATSCAYAAYLFFLVAASLGPELSSAQRIGGLRSVSLIILPPLAVSYCLETVAPGLDVPLAVALPKIFAVLLAWAPAAWGGWRLSQNSP